MREHTALVLLLLRLRALGAYTTSCFQAQPLCETATHLLACVLSSSTEMQAVNALLVQLQVTLVTSAEPLERHRQW